MGACTIYAVNFLPARKYDKNFFLTTAKTACSSSSLPASAARSARMVFGPCDWQIIRFLAQPWKIDISVIIYDQDLEVRLRKLGNFVTFTGNSVPWGHRKMGLGWIKVLHKFYVNSKILNSWFFRCVICRRSLLQNQSGKSVESPISQLIVH